MFPTISDYAQSSISDGNKKSIAQFNSKRIFVKNFQSDLSAQQLAQFFENFGTVATCQVKADKSGAPIAVVEFAEAQSAMVAVQELDKKNVYGCVWNVQPFKQREPSEQNRSNNVLLVRNLPPNTDKNSIRTAFSRFGQVTYVAMSAPNPRTPQWTAYVTFSDPTGAENALRQMQSFRVGDGALPLHLSFAPPRRVPPSETVCVAEIPVAWPETDVRQMLELFGALKFFELLRDAEGYTQTAMALFESPQNASEAMQSLPQMVREKTGVELKIKMMAYGSDGSGEKRRTLCRFYEMGKCLKMDKCPYTHGSAVANGEEIGASGALQFFTGKQ